MTALAIACYHGFTAVVNVLLQVPGVDINHQCDLVHF